MAKRAVKCRVRVDGWKTTGPSLSTGRWADEEHRCRPARLDTEGRRHRRPPPASLIGLWCLAIKRGLPLRAVADLTLPCPTMSESARPALGQHYRGTLFGKTTRRLVAPCSRYPHGRDELVAACRPCRSRRCPCRGPRRSPSAATRHRPDPCHPVEIRAHSACCSDYCGPHRPDETWIHARPPRAGRRGDVEASVDGLDVGVRRLQCEGGRRSPTTSRRSTSAPRPMVKASGRRRHTVPVRPIDGFLRRIDLLRRARRAGQTTRIAVVGGGRPGWSWPVGRPSPADRTPRGRRPVDGAHPSWCPARPPSFRTSSVLRRKAPHLLEEAGAEVVTGAPVAAVEPGRSILDGSTAPCRRGRDPTG